MKRLMEKNKKSGGSKTKDEVSQAKEEQSEPSIERPPPGTPSQVGDADAIAETVDKAPASNREHGSPPTSPTEPSRDRQPSLSLQSKMRSSSFRQTSISQGPLSPTTNGAKSPLLDTMSPYGDTVTDIYRKQATRLDELEKENRRLAREASDAEGRWKSMEAELEELREARPEVEELRSRAQKADAKDEELSRLVCSIVSMFT